MRYSSALYICICTYILSDSAILGDADWGSTTCFSLEPNNSNDVVEIHAKAHHKTFVVVLVLTAANFQESLGKASLEVKSFIDTFYAAFLKRRAEGLGEDDKHLAKIVLVWESLVRKRLKLARKGTLEDGDADGQEQWNFAAKLKHSKPPNRAGYTCMYVCTHILVIVGNCVETAW